ncbi:uncharacterized protein EDB93DRAFT_1253720 [Suillus bovinus]|uniref:uncharacterized protein n=1 Tax=Suillus bovinus TaxID=48563 RepID=UPI001B880544|nr:uncharacterized protein EDB93DRAFT_1253720 [Suillus bovinus]KAG2137104.1 hypothetical protein EDB93DRAFT_1253720 [Suillus bovinus]
MSGIDSDRLIKRAQVYLDLNTESSNDQDDMEDESFLASDHDPDDHLRVPTPLQDEAAWNILEDYLTTDMTFPQMEVKLTVTPGGIEAGSPNEKREVFWKQISDAPVQSTPNTVLLEDSDGGVVDQTMSIVQSTRLVPTSALPTWLITVPFPSRSLHVPKSDIGQDPCTPCLFNSPGGKIIYKDGRYTYIHGLLSLKLARTAVVEIAIPTPQDIVIHRESGCNPALVQSTLHAYAAQHWMQDDLVQITAGELCNCLGKILCVDMATCSTLIYMEELLHVGKVSSTPLMFPITNLERKFRVGDNVHMLADSIEAVNHKGKMGMVVEVGIKGNSIVFTIRTYCLATYITESRNLNPGDTSVCHHDNPMRGDYVVVVDRVYCLQFGEVTEVDLVMQSLTFLSSELGMLSVPMRQTAFNPNPTALQYTNERGYDVVAGDTVRVIRGEQLHLSGTVRHMNLETKMLTFQVTPYTKVTTSITYVARIGRWSDRDLMQSIVSQEVFVIRGPMKSYRGTLHLLSQDTCVVAVVQNSRRVFRREHVVSRTGILLNSVHLPLNLHTDFNNLIRASFIRAPHVEPPQTLHPSPPPVVLCSDQPADPVIESSWDAHAESVLHHLSSECTGTAPKDCWTIDEEDLTELQMIPPSGGLSTSPADSLVVALHNPHLVKLFFDWHMKFRIVKTHTAVWYSSYIDCLVDTLVPNPFVSPQGLVKDGDIAIRYSSRTSNKGMKVDTIPVEVLAPEPSNGIKQAIHFDTRQSCWDYLYNEESELLDTPVKRGCSTMLTHTTNARHRIPTINAMGKEMQGFLVGPMDAEDFLQEFLPVTKIPDNTFTSGAFDTTISAKDKVQAYEPFLVAF